MKATSYRLKVEQSGRFRTVGKAHTDSGLRKAITMAREKFRGAEIRIVAPDGRRVTLKPGDAI